MKPTIKDLKFNAQVKLKGNYGQAILAVMVPGIIAYVIMMIFNTIIGDIVVLPTIVSLIVNGGAAFMTLTMILRLSRNHRTADIGSSLSPSNRLGQYMIYTFVLGLVGFVAQLPVNVAMFGELFPNSAIIETTMYSYLDDNPIEFLQFVYTYFGLVIGIVLLIQIITLPLYFTTYIIVDEDINFFSAMKKSLKFTKGNILRIIGLNLSFIGWYIVVGITFGLAGFYVAPYHQMAITNLYLACKEEQGEDLKMYKPVFNNETYEPQTDWVEDQKEETSNSWDF